MAPRLMKATREVVPSHILPIYQSALSEACGTESKEISKDSCQLDYLIPPCSALLRDRVEYVVYEPVGKKANKTVKRVPVFTTLLGGEAVPLILQLAASNAETALAAARLVQHDVQGIDLNMGCPKRSATGSGMGAELMKHPERACEILSTLVQNIKVPISVKTRLCETDEQSVALIRQLAETGVHAVTLHARTVEQRSSTEALHCRFRVIRDALGGDFAPSLILNGDVMPRKFDQLRHETQCSGVMVAREAFWDPMVFTEHMGQGLPTQTEGRDSEDLKIVQTMLCWHLAFHTPFSAIKYHVCRAMQEQNICKGILAAATSARTPPDLCCALYMFSSAEVSDNKNVLYTPTLFGLHIPLFLLINAYREPKQIVEAPEAYVYPPSYGVPTN